MREGRAHEREGEKAGTTTSSLRSMSKLLEQYGCGPIQFTGTNDALYERHILFNNVVDPATKAPRDHYEAVARSVRTVILTRIAGTRHDHSC